MSLVLYIGNTSVLELRNLKSSISGAYDNSATVSYVLADSSGTTVSTGTMTSITESPNHGKYRASIASTVVLTGNRRYTAIINVTGSGGEVAKWTLVVTPATRGIND